MSLHSRKTLEAFKEWLTARGAEVMAPTNEFELVRFKSGKDTLVIYTNGRKSKITGNNPIALKVLHSFEHNLPWRAPKISVRDKASRGIHDTIIERDGDECIFCAMPFTQDNPATIEHMLAVIHGQGTGLVNHIANKARAHRQCNEMAGHLSVAEKVMYAVNTRLALAAQRAEQEAAELAAQEARPAPLLRAVG